MEDNNLQNDDNRKRRNAKIRNICSIIGSSFVGVVVLLAVILSSLADKIWDLNGPPIKMALIISSCAFGGCFFGGVLAVFIIKLCKIKKTDDQELIAVKNAYSAEKDALSKIASSLSTNVQSIRDCINILHTQRPPCQNVVDSLNSLMDFEKGKEYLINSHQVDELERSVSIVPKVKDRRIFIQSSSFTLETRKDGSSLLPTILYNLRHRVKYTYIVPSIEKAIKGFLHMITEWWDEYTCFIDDINKCESLLSEIEIGGFDEDYVRCVSTIKENSDKNILTEKVKNEIREQCLRRFLKLIELHISRECHLFVTVALYQKDNENGDDYTKYYDAIVKLPTSPADTEEEYYAYRIPESNPAEFGAFCKRFLSTYDRSIVNEEHIEIGYRNYDDIISQLEHINSSGHKINIIPDDKALEDSKFFLSMQEGGR